MNLMERKVSVSVTLKIGQLEFIKKQPRGWLSGKIQEIIDAEKDGQQIGQVVEEA